MAQKLAELDFEGRGLHLRDELSVAARLRLDPAVAPAKAHLVEVALEVFRAEVVIDAEHGAVEDAAERLDGVGVDVAADVFLCRVIDRLMEARDAAREPAAALPRQRRAQARDFGRAGPGPHRARPDRRHRGGAARHAKPRRSAPGACHSCCARCADLQRRL